MTTVTADPVPKTGNITPTRLQLVALRQLMPSRLNPRRRFENIDALARSLKAQGVHQPLLARPVERPEGVEIDVFEVVDGERRYRAAQQANLITVPVIVKDLTDAEVLEIQLVSAIQRDGLTPLDEARGYRALIDSNPARYSAAYIADRISRSERYVVDRMRLLSLVPELQRLLEQDRIGVAHAELLAKLKPADQTRAADPDGRGGLWQAAAETLDFGEDEDALRDADPYYGLKVATVKELEAWVARHVRFDLEHAATTAPLEFGRVQLQVDAAQAKTGRGKKSIHITHDDHLADDVKDPSTRVYGPRSWKRADGTVGSVYDYRSGKHVDAPTCEHAVLGLVVAGPEYGKAFDVCIARDRCRVHWAAELKAREADEKLKASGRGAEVNKRALKAREEQETRVRREEEAKQRDREVYVALHDALKVQIDKRAPATLTPGVFAWIWREVNGGQPPKGLKPGGYIAALVASKLEKPNPSAWYPQDQIRRAIGLAEAVGLDGKALEKAARDQVAAQRKAAAKPATAKAAKTAKRKAAKR